jgi:hypothetical protein
MWTLYESDEVEVAAVEEGNAQDKDASHESRGIDSELPPHDQSQNPWHRLSKHPLMWVLEPLRVRGQ